MTGPYQLQWWQAEDGTWRVRFFGEERRKAPVRLTGPYDRRWHWKASLPDRKGAPCRIIARGTMNSGLIEFEDGFSVISPRYAVRKAL